MVSIIITRPLGCKWMLAGAMLAQGGVGVGVGVEVGLGLGPPVRRCFRMSDLAR